MPQRPPYTPPRDTPSQRVPPIGADVSSMMPIGSDVSALMGMQPPPPAQETAAEPRSYFAPPSVGELVDATGRFIKGGAEAAYNVVRHPVDTAVGLATMPYQLTRGHMSLGQEAYDEARAGNYGQAVTNAALSVIPVGGPIIKSGIEAFQEGKGPEWAGEQAAFIAGGRFLTRGGKPRAAAVATDDAAQIARYGMEHGVDPRLGDAIGGVAGSALKRLDQAAQNTTFAGAKLTGDQARRRSQGLATLGEQLEAKSGQASVGRAEAGRQAQQRVSRDVTQLANESGAEYQALQNLEHEITRARQLGAGQVEVPPAFPVNFEQFRNDPGVRRLHGTINRTKGVGAPNAAAQSAFESLDALLNSDVVMSLSDADMVLRGFKDAQRRIRAGGSVPGTRSPQIVDSIVSRLSAMVDSAAKKAGPEVVESLRVGRELWKEKIEMQGFLKQLDGEPAAIIGKITKADDGGINFVNTIQRFAPEQVDVLSQTILSKMVQSVIDPRLRNTSLSAWQRLGPETKLALFKDAAYIKELDKFFHLARQVEADLNPSGSGYTAAISGHVGVMSAAAVSGNIKALLVGLGVEGAAVLNAALNSPKAVRAIVRYLEAPPSMIRAGAQTLSREGQMLRQNTVAALQQAVKEWQRSVSPSRSQGAGPVGRGGGPMGGGR